MERGEYLQRAKLASIRRAQLGRHFKPERYPELLVCYGGISYIPDSYTLSFDGNGNAVHTVGLKDICAHSVTVARLDSVQAPLARAEPRKGAE